MDELQVCHVWFWELDGLTDLDNLIPLCHCHHHLVHDSGWRLTLDKTDRTLTVALADGSATRTMRPAGLQPPATRAGPRLPSEPSTTAARRAAAMASSLRRLSCAESGHVLVCPSIR